MSVLIIGLLWQQNDKLNSCNTKIFVSLKMSNIYENKSYSTGSQFIKTDDKYIGKCTNKYQKQIVLLL